MTRGKTWSAGTELERKAEAIVYECVSKANEWLKDVDQETGIEYFRSVVVEFEEGTLRAGSANFGTNVVTLNSHYLKTEWESMSRETIPHEVAHLTVFAMMRNAGVGRMRGMWSAHGTYWKLVMRKCFGLEPDRCHEYDRDPKARKMRRWTYQCGCREYKLTTVRRNRDIKSRRAKGTGHYRCTSCKKTLEPATPSVVQ